MYTILSIILIVAEFIILSYFVYHTYYLKKVVTKNVIGYFVPLYLIVYIINCIGLAFNKGGSFLSIYEHAELISKTIKVFAFEIDGSIVSGLSATNTVYFIATIIAYCMAFLTTLTTVLGIFRRHIMNGIYVIRSLKQDCDIVIGNSADSLAYAKTNRNTIIWYNGFSSVELEQLSKLKIPVIKKEFIKKEINAKFRKNKVYHFIAFKDSNFAYSDIIDVFSKIKKEEQSIFYLHLESEVEDMDIIRDKYISQVDEYSNSFVTCFNKYELMARQFVTKHPISKYLPKKFYNEDRQGLKATIKNDKEINVVMLGFGKVNSELLKLSIIQNQFVKEQNGELYNKQVNYYIYDNQKDKLDNEMFIKLVYEYEHLSENEKLPKLEKLCNIKKELINVKSIVNFENLEKIITEDSFTYIIVSIGSDLENASLAKKIYEDFNKKGNIKVFVRFKDNSASFFEKEQNDIICFGEKGRTLTHKLVVNNMLMDVSKIVNNMYAGLSENKLADIQKWERLPLIKQYSNIYNSLSIYFKIGLLGYELTLDNNIPQGYKEVSKEEYEQQYFKNVNKEYNYQDYFKINNRNILAFSEHSRWNAHYYLSDYKPMKLDDVKLVNNKLVTQSQFFKLHSCLTTFKGLDILHQKMLEESKKLENSISIDNVETYKYDYMFMDNAYDTLTSNGYLIIKKEN